ncbi:MAG: dTMP kinase [Thermomonas sp.]|uniref:dTMP kinase n=1 Tax=Thermomonas sp. TaxID=1971895 RepID=UPI001B4F02B4|nr:dTMP kinase [Thermomonas sp.]MBP7157671.1 dTMP kinase [Thermomonas sp.]MBP7788305.1 dTMP kinase [Thermomonas sp.]MBP8614794.1 dTMP kinase [Thermomonas sp.]MBP8647036.1 dTMP kinase [Thermomonas sp.]
MISSLPDGFLIAIDGIDGAGKTTLARRLGDTLGYGGTPVTVSKEPTHGQWGNKLRESAATGRLDVAEEVSLLLLDRREHVDTLIAPALARGECVILDRYYPSMVAYQGAAGLPTAELLLANDFAPRADVLLVLDLPPAVGLARIHARGDKPNAFETQDTLEACRAIFLSTDAPGKHVVDATRSAEEVYQAALQIIVLAVAAKARRSLPAVEAVEAIGGMLPNLATA